MTPTGVGMRVWTERMGAADRAWLERLARRQAPPWLDRSLKIVTHAGGSLFTIALPFLLIALPASRRLGEILLLSNAMSHVLVQLLKRTVVRPRPRFSSDSLTPLGHVPDAYSFPSGHACAATAIAVPMALAGSPAAIVALPIAMLVGMSRVYLRVHYVTDVLVGQLLGTAGALVAWAVLG